MLPNVGKLIAFQVVKPKTEYCVKCTIKIGFFQPPKVINTSRSCYKVRVDGTFLLNACWHKFRLINIILTNMGDNHENTKSLLQRHY
jgi:hypothetical protein